MYVNVQAANIFCLLLNSCSCAVSWFCFFHPLKLYKFKLRNSSLHSMNITNKLSYQRQRVSGYLKAKYVRCVLNVLSIYTIAHTQICLSASRYTWPRNLRARRKSYDASSGKLYDETQFRCKSIFVILFVV